MYKVIKASNSYLQDELDFRYPAWTIRDVDRCKEILRDFEFDEMKDDTFSSPQFEDSTPYICTISFDIPSKEIYCKVEDILDSPERRVSQVSVRNKGSVFATFSHAIQWLAAHGLPSNIASRILYATPVG